MCGCAAPSAISTQSARHPLYPLLFDPQTAGGLLAAVPLGEAELASLRCVPRAMPTPRSSASCRTASAALEPVTLDLTGALLAEALTGSFPGGERTRSLRENVHTEEPIH